MAYVFLDPDDLLAAGLDPEMIQRAETRIRGYLHSAVFETRADGTPVDPDVRERLRQATVAQAQAWADWGITPTTMRKRVSTTGRLGPATVTYDGGDKYAERFAAARDRLAPEAEAWIRPLLQQPTY